MEFSLVMEFYLTMKGMPNIHCKEKLFIMIIAVQDVDPPLLPEK